MKLPKHFNKLSNLQQREYIYKALEEKYKEVKELVNLSRRLADGKATVQIEERPDVEILKTGS